MEGTEISLGKKNTIYIYGWIGRNFWEDQVGTGKEVRRGGSGREYGERLLKLRGIWGIYKWNCKIMGKAESSPSKKSTLTIFCLFVGGTGGPRTCYVGHIEIAKLATNSWTNLLHPLPPMCWGYRHTPL